MGVKTRSAPALAHCREVVVEGPGVAGEVFRRPELRGVDEDRDDDEAGLGPAPLDQPVVPSCRAPIVGTKPTRRPAWRARPTSARTAATVSTGSSKGLSSRRPGLQARRRPKEP